MRITHFANSFINITSGNTNLICDPWIGTTDENAWISDPINNQGHKIVNSINPKFIYISHLHCDHFDKNLLRKIKNKNFCFLIKKFKSPILKKRIQSLGFKKIIELKEWTPFRLNKDLTVAIVPQISNNNEDIESAIEYDLDTSIIVKCNNENKVFYNNVDNPLASKHIKKIKNFIKRKFKKNVDVSTFNIGAASEYPQCFLNVNRNKEKKKIIKKSFQNVYKKISILKSPIFFPSGGSYKISGKFFDLNKFVAIPNSHQLKKMGSKKIQLINLIGGKSLLINNNLKVLGQNKTNYSFKNNKIRKLKYMYEKQSDKFNLSQFNEVFYESLANYFTRIRRYKVNKAWDVNFYLFDNLKLNKKNNIDFKKSKLLKKYNLNYPNNGKKYLLELFLDSKLFLTLLKRKISWNTALSGSLILFKRKPNKFVPDIPFSLNFLTV